MNDWIGADPDSTGRLQHVASSPSRARQDGETLEPARLSGSRERRVLGALVVYWLAMFVGTHIPHVPQVGDLHPPDYLLHFAAYFGLAFLMAVWCQFRAGVAVPRQMAGVVVICMVYGAIDELTQIPVGRHAAWDDWLADTAGAIAGVLAAIAVWRFARYLRR